MSEYGAVLQSNVMELVKYVEKFKNQRQLLDEEIQKSETEQAKLIEDIEAIQEKLEVRNNRLLALRQRRDELNATLDKAGVDLKQLLDSSDAVLGYVKRQSTSNQLKVNNP